MLLNNIPTLGRQRNCKWINMGGGVWQWVCFNSEGGGNAPGGGLKGLSGNILTPAQISAMSIQGLRNIIADHQRRIAEIDARVQYESTLLYPWDDATRQQWLNEKTALLANIAAIQAWINLPSKQKAKTDGGKFIIKTRNSFLDTINKVVNNNNSDSSNPGGFLEDTKDFLTTQYAGVPIWGIVVLAGAGLYVVSSNKKKMKRA